MVWVILAFIISLVLAVGWIYFFWRLDKYEKEPIKALVITFLLGALGTFVAGFVNVIGAELFGLNEFLDNLDITNTNLLILFIYLIIVVGIGEELVKFIPVRFYAFRKKFFNEPFDGLVYASTSAAGFLFVEDIEYILLGFDQGVEQGLEMVYARIISSPMHILFASYWGLELGLYKKNPSRKYLVIGNLILAGVLHGLYDFFVFTGLFMFSIPLVIFLIILLIRKVRYAQRISPFTRINYLVECKFCNAKIKPNILYCTNCGKPTDWIDKENPVNLNYYCGNCENKILFGQKTCPNCKTKIRWK